MEVNEHKHEFSIIDKIPYRFKFNLLENNGNKYIQFCLINNHNEKDSCNTVCGIELLEHYPEKCIKYLELNINSCISHININGIEGMSHGSGTTTPGTANSD